MNQNRLFFIAIIFSSGAFALEGLTGLEKKLFENNPEFQAIQMQVESKEALSRSSNSNFYPTLSAVGGIGQNRTDDLLATEKGYVGYFEGKLNLFKGFKDQSIKDQRSLDLQVLKIELESKKRELRFQLTEIASNMIFIHKFQSIIEEEYKLTQTQKQMAAKKVAAGLTGSIDNLEFELRENELQIEQRQINQQHQEIHQNFIRLFGEDVADADMDKLDFSAVENLVKPASQIKIENTLDYQKSDLAQKQAELERKEIRADYLPSLDFSYSAGRITPSEDNPIKFNESRYALLLTIPLFSGFDTYYKTKSAALLSQASEKLKDQKRNNIDSDLNIVKTKLLEISSLFQINEKKLANSQKYFDLTLSEYKRGIKNSPDLVTATDRLFSSKKKKYGLLKELELLNVKLANYN